MILSAIGKVKRWSRSHFLVGKAIIRSSLIPVGNKKIYIEINDLFPNRYLYNFLKFFVICGYTVYIPRDFRLLRKLQGSKGESEFSSWILKERIKVGRPKKNYEIINRERLSNDYFRGNNIDGSYHVPMSEFSAFYFYNIEQPSIIPVENRKNSIFMAGNLDSNFYDRISSSPYFKLPSRYRTSQYLQKRSDMYQKIETKKELGDFIFSQLDQKVIIIDTLKDFRIPLKELKGILVHFNFYLALPGVSMPQCHNVVEAMSVGCIPIIHEVYAKSFKPPLRHLQNSIIYKDLGCLADVISDATNLSTGSIKNLSENVLLYNSEYLSSAAVVQKIIKKKPTKIFIQAELLSLALLKKNEDRG